MAKFYDLFRDTREEWPVSTEVGAWGGAKFVRMVKRHMDRKVKYPDAPPALGKPYEGIDNLRPESIAAVQEFLLYDENTGDVTALLTPVTSVSPVFATIVRDGSAIFVTARSRLPH